MSHVDTSSFNLLSVCSGVGMLDVGAGLALEYVLGKPSRCVGYCERNGYAASSLLARMEEASLEPAPVWAGDLADFPWDSFRGVVDGLVAGFPCQPWSGAGKQLGTGDERWLWPLLARAIREVGCEIVLLENVDGLISGGGLEHVISDLTAMGFVCEWGCLTAESVGASHRRLRVFIVGCVADATGTRRTGRKDARADSGNAGKNRSRSEQSERDQCKLAHTESERLGKERRSDSGWPSRTARPDADMDNSNGGRCEQREPGKRDTEVPREGHIQLDNPERYRRESGRGDNGGNERDIFASTGGIFAPGPTDLRWIEILEESPWLSPAIEPGLRLLVDGMAFLLDESRADQIRCGGNGVVPLQAAAAFVELLRRCNA